MGPSLGIVDYCVFSVVLALSAIIGAYFAFFAKQKQNTTSEYLMGGRSMGVFPVSMSLISSFISGVTLLGMPAEMYVFGTQFWIVIIPIILSALATGMLFVPVFYQLQLTSSYEYFSLRFDSKVRKLGSLLYVMNIILFIPVVIYIPGLAFSQVSGISHHMVTPWVCLICIFYTSLGGLKAVLWADTLQTLMMFGSMIVIVTMGTIFIGGPLNVWNLSKHGGRIEFFNFDPDPTVRHTFWTVTVGSFFLWLSDVSANQGMIQRFLSMPTLKGAQWCLMIFSIGSLLIVSISCYAGLLVYATYHDCDLLSTNIVKRNDQLLPYFVMDVAQSIPGLPGLFMAGVFSAALSTMSTGLNSLSGVIYKDFIHNWLKAEPSEGKASFIMKITCVVIGIICTAMVLLIEKMGPVIHLTGSLLSVALGPLLALFTLGMLFPWSNSKGALYGGITGLVFMACLVFGAQQAIVTGRLKFAVKPVSYVGCSDNNISVPLMPTPHLPSSQWNPSTESITAGEQATTQGVADDVHFVFRISYRYYALMGFLVTLASGMAVSFCTGLLDPASVDPILLSPPIRNLVHSLKLPRERHEGKLHKEKHLDDIDDDSSLPLSVNP